MKHVYERDVPMTTRDGATLLADVWRPEEGRAPTLLVRTPYDKRTSLHYGGPNSIPSLIHFLNAGYAVVLQDARGTTTSEGVFEPKVNELADGEDTVAWILEQDWSDGAVGTCGASYLGMTQWAVAVAGTPGGRSDERLCELVFRSLVLAGRRDVPEPRHLVERLHVRG